MSCTIVSATASASRPSSPVTGDRRLAGHRLHERLELEPQRLAFGRVERDALDERLERLRALRVAHERREIDVAGEGDRTRRCPPPRSSDR